MIVPAEIGREAAIADGPVVYGRQQSRRGSGGPRGLRPHPPHVVDVSDLLQSGGGSTLDFAEVR
jgi:hypothetical protein